jgi:hypothetical protein
MRLTYFPAPGFKQIPVVGPVKDAGCPPPHTVQEEHHIQRPGYFLPYLIRQGQNAARGLSVFAQMKDHFNAVDPILATHIPERNYPGSFNHFFTSAILRYPKYLAGPGDGIALFYENMDFIS